MAKRQAKPTVAARPTVIPLAEWETPTVPRYFRIPKSARRGDRLPHGYMFLRADKVGVYTVAALYRWSGPVVVLLGPRGLVERFLRIAQGHFRFIEDQYDCVEATADAAVAQLREHAVPAVKPDTEAWLRRQLATLNDNERR